MDKEKIQEAILNKTAENNEHLQAIHALTGEMVDKLNTLTKKEIEIPEQVDNTDLLKSILEESKKEYKINIKLNVK